jgi:hypothetical protein
MNSKLNEIKVHGNLPEYYNLLQNKDLKQTGTAGGYQG